jgi:hypothetical protein
VVAAGDCSSKALPGCSRLLVTRDSLRWRVALGGCKSTFVQPASSIHTLSLRGADNPSSRNHPPRFCLSTRDRVILYKDRKALLSEPVSSLRGAIALACEKGGAGEIVGLDELPVAEFLAWGEPCRLLAEVRMVAYRRVACLGETRAWRRSGLSPGQGVAGRAAQAW